MFKRFSITIMCIVVLLSFIACNTDDTHQNDSASNQTETSLTNDTSKNKTSKPTEEKKSVFKTESIIRITFYAYYGGGKGSSVPAENMSEIISWLDSFTIDREATDEDVPPGTNTYYVEIEYSNGTVIKEGLDIVFIDGTRYLLEKDNYPDCFMDIISKASLE